MRGWAQVTLFVMLFALAIPWYWRAAGLSPTGRTAGVPNWFLVAVLGSAAISTAAAWQFHRSPWDQDRPQSKETR